MLLMALLRDETLMYAVLFAKIPMSGSFHLA